MPFINYSELCNSGGSFARQEVIVNGTTTIVYGGYAPASDPTTADDRLGWQIRKLIIDERGANQIIQSLWAVGTWTNRANLDYKYYLE